MTRGDRKLMKRLETLWRDDPDIGAFPPIAGLDRLMQLGYLNREAFFDETVQSDREVAWHYTPKNYPLSRIGYEELHKNWYLRLSNNPIYRFAFDLFALAAVVVSVYVAITPQS